MIKLDLKDAYFCVPIHKDHQQYFRFQWLNSIREFSCLPFVSTPEMELIEKEIKELEEKEAIEQVSPVQNQFLSNLFLVKKKDGATVLL